jgi:hypothetical protein
MHAPLARLHSTYELLDSKLVVLPARRCQQCVVDDDRLVNL